MSDKIHITIDTANQIHFKMIRIQTNFVVFVHPQQKIIQSNWNTNFIQSMEKKKRLNCDELPDDCILEILNFLNEEDLCRLNMSSKKFKFSTYSVNNIFWKKIFERKYNFSIFNIKINEKNDYSYKKSVKSVYNEIEKYFSSYDPQKKFKYVESGLLVCLYNLIKEPVYKDLRVTIVGDR